MIFLWVVSDRLGMPPSYMVVDIRWDDYAEEPSQEIVQLQDPTKLVQLQDPTKEILFQHHTSPPPPNSPDRKRWACQKFERPSIYLLWQLVPELQFAQDPPKIISGWSGATISTLFQYSWFSNIQILCWRTDLRSNVEHLAVLKLLITKLTKPNRVDQVITKLTNPNSKLQSISAAISTVENHGKTATTENHEGDFLL